MKKIACSLLVLLCLTAFSAVSDASNRNNVQSIVVDDFDQQWTAAYSGTADEAKTKVQIVDGGANNDYLSPESSSGSRKCMGVKAGYVTKGYNWIELTPANPVKLPGDSKELQLWVLGMQYQWSMEVYLRDYRGVVHKVEMGSLYFEGWSSLQQKIPSWIPQSEDAYPKDRPLSIVKIVLRSDPYARNDRFYIYFDQIVVKSDVYQQFFDGMDMINRTTW